LPLQIELLKLGGWAKKNEEKNVELVSDLDEKIVRPATALMPTYDEIVYSFVRGT
jgi:hypothetical protein